MQTRRQERILQVEQRIALASISSSRFAPEIIDWIIDFLQSDRDALKACSLVCKSWLPRTRFHLFRRFRISAREANTFLSSTNEILRISLTNMKDLEIGSQSTRHHWFPTKSAWTGLASLPVLESLTLHRVNRTRISLSVKMSPNSATLKHLYIHRMDDKGCDASDVLRIVCTFPCLESVSLLWCSMKVTEVTANTERLPSTLRSLVVLSQRMFDDYVHKWICAHKLLPPISSATLNVGSLRLRPLLSSFGEHLEHLELVGHIPFAHDPWSMFELSRNRSLRSLHITKSYNRNNSSILVLLSQIDSPLFQSFTFDITVHDPSHLPWEAFMKALQRFSGSLTAVEFKVRVLAGAAFIHGDGDIFEMKCQETLNCVKVSLRNGFY